MIRTGFLEALVTAGALSQSEDRHFLIVRRTRWRSQPGSPERTLIEHHQQHVQSTPQCSPPSREDLLLSVLRGTNLLGSVWSEEALERQVEAIERCTARASIGRDVRRLVDARQVEKVMEAAMGVAVDVAVAACVGGSPGGSRKVHTASWAGFARTLG